MTKELIKELIKNKCICRKETISKRLKEIDNMDLTEEQFNKIYMALIKEECLSCHGFNRLDSHLNKFNGLCSMHNTLNIKKFM
jgi:hypothetical protein